MELAIVLVIALVIFGPKRLPDLGKSLGKGMREFKSSISGDDEHQTPDAEQKRLEAMSASTAQASPAETQG